MQSIRSRLVAAGHQSPSLWIGVRSISTSDAASLTKNVGSLLDSLGLKSGGSAFPLGDLYQLCLILFTYYCHPIFPRYMKRLAGELSPTAGLNFSDGYQATAVCKAVADGGTFLTYGKKFPKNVVYDGAVRKPVEWSAFLKEKNLKVLNL